MSESTLRDLVHLFAPLAALLKQHPLLEPDEVDTTRLVKLLGDLASTPYQVVNDNGRVVVMSVALDYLEQRSDSGISETWRWLFPNSKKFEPRVQASGNRFKRTTGPDINGAIQFDS